MTNAVKLVMLLLNGTVVAFGEKNLGSRIRYLHASFAAELLWVFAAIFQFLYLQIYFVVYTFENRMPYNKICGGWLQPFYEVYYVNLNSLVIMSLINKWSG